MPVMLRRRAALAAVLALLAFALPMPTLAGDRPTTVIFVRHAEKAATPPDDPPLTDAGRERAETLARVVGSAGVSAVITSQVERTRATAVPLAAKLGLTPVVVEAHTDPKTKHSTPAATKALVDEIMKHAGATVLVVGHSNTVPDTIAALGGPADLTIDESVFDDLFVVTVTGPGRATAVHLKYGR